MEESPSFERFWRPIARRYFDGRPTLFKVSARRLLRRGGLLAGLRAGLLLLPLLFEDRGDYPHRPLDLPLEGEWVVALRGGVVEEPLVWVHVEEGLARFVDCHQGGAVQLLQVGPPGVVESLLGDESHLRISLRLGPHLLPECPVKVVHLHLPLHELPGVEGIVHRCLLLRYLELRGDQGEREAHLREVVAPLFEYLGTRLLRSAHFIFTRWILPGAYQFHLPIRDITA